MTKWSLDGWDWQKVNNMDAILGTQETSIWPEWVSTSGVDLWQPDVLYMEWLVFLFKLWDNVEYL
ncbi:hypothetical protein EU538_12320 [Candidatus Thorarchaeota archaeon]|nr:MAG: hypothetical protein EU538_12320 [Candidatus Thorarchaeota archaeon]